MSNIKFWNKQNSNNQNNDSKTTKNGRDWLHAPDVLVNGHVAYLVKFLGSTPVERPKGIEAVKEAIRRLQFTQQIKKAEGGSNAKIKKVEITVSVDGVAIQEPRTQTILHQFPLHKISYCADEKGVKKYFSFIAKTGTSTTSPSSGTTTSLSSNDDTTTNNSSGSLEDGHECFVFISNKLASDITLTIGQAFDLAYKRYVNDSGKSGDSVKIQAQNKQLENTVNAYRQRLKDLSEMVSKSDLDKLLIRLGLRDITEIPQMENGIDAHINNINGSKTPDLGIDVSSPNNEDQLLIETSPKHFAPIVPPRNIQNQLSSTLEALKPSSVGTKLDELLLNSDSDSDFDPRAPDNELTVGNKISNDLFGMEPIKPTLGQQLFSSPIAPPVNQNGFATTNGSLLPPTSPPPMLAPPPQKSAPRRNNSSNLVNNNNSHDLFGSTPFNPGFADSDSNMVSNFSEEIQVLANNSKNLESLFTANPNAFAPNPAPKNGMVETISNGIEYLTNQPITHKLNPFAIQSPTSFQDMTKEFRMPFGDANRVDYDAFKNASSDNESFNKTPEVRSNANSSSDLFNDFALSAFNNLKKDLSSKKSNSEYSNDMIIQRNSSFDFQKSPPRKDIFNTDDITLESFDPLRK